MKIKRFDERQMQIRGEIFFHGLMTAFALLFINAFLIGSNIVWASGFQQNIIIIILTGMVVIVEAILRDAFFSVGQMRWPIIVTFGVVAVVLVVWGVGAAARGYAPAYGGSLTDSGFLLVAAVMPVSVTVAGLVKEITEKLRHED